MIVGMNHFTIAAEDKYKSGRSELLKAFRRFIAMLKVEWASADSAPCLRLVATGTFQELIRKFMAYSTGTPALLGSVTFPVSDP